MPRCLGPLADFVRRCGTATSGSAAVLFCVVLPAVVLVSVGAADYTCAKSDRGTLQGIADSAALAAAGQLAVDSSSATAQRAKIYAQSSLTNLIGNWDLHVDAQVVNSGAAVQVTITGHRPALLNNMLPSEGWDISVSATAQSEGVMPLCALGTRRGSGGVLGLGRPSNVIDLQGSALVTAPNCMIKSNQNIAAENSARISAGAVQAVGEASGSSA